ncbi:MAG: hypothetical protein IJK20_01250 [Bacteroidales bacterium]|nr:hypothetical protein [Bacteroidales bacterium]
MKRFGRFFATAMLLVSAGGAVVFAQEKTADTGYSPYSLFGFGQLEGQGTTFNASMGSLGLAVRNTRFINVMNPAAVTARENKSFMMDFGVRENNVVYTADAATSGDPAATGTLRSANNTFNLNHIILSFPMWRNTAFKVGVMPYSSVGYSLRSFEQSDELISEVGDVQYYRIGQGGLYKAFLGAGITLWDRLSLGVDGQYYFGNIVRYSYANFTTSSAYRSINSGWDNYLSGLNAKFGLQYEQPLGAKVALTLGATFQLGTNISGESRRFAYGIASSTDTITNVTTQLPGYRMPMEIGAGFTLRGADRWMVGFDYTRQDWTSTSFDATPGVNFAPACQQSFRLGAELTPNRYDVRHFMNRLTYHGGIFYEQGYLSLNGHQVTDRGITLGVSVPVSRYYNSISLGVTVGQRGTVDNNLIRETYATINLAFSLHDIWFLKQMYE